MDIRQTLLLSTISPETTNLSTRLSQLCFLCTCSGPICPRILFFFSSLQLRRWRIFFFSSTLVTDTQSVKEAKHGYPGNMPPIFISVMQSISINVPPTNLYPSPTPTTPSNVFIHLCSLSFTLFTMQAFLWSRLSPSEKGYKVSILLRTRGHSTSHSPLNSSHLMLNHFLKWKRWRSLFGPGDCIHAYYRGTTLGGNSSINMSLASALLWNKHKYSRLFAMATEEQVAHTDFPQLSFSIDEQQAPWTPRLHKRKTPLNTLVMDSISWWFGTVPLLPSRHMSSCFNFEEEQADA